jgi:hypothetical protein
VWSSTIRQELPLFLSEGTGQGIEGIEGENENIGGVKT